MSNRSERDANIEYAATGILETLERIDTEELPQKGRASAHGAIAGNARDIGLYRLLNGDTRAAAPWFDHASRRFLKKHETYKVYAEAHGHSQWEGEPISLTDALHAALLAGSPDRCRAAADAVGGVDETYPDAYPDSRSRYDYVRALAAVITDSPDRDALVETLATNLDGTPDGARERYAAYATVLRGVTEQNVATVQDGIQALVEDHVATFTGNPTTIDEMVSVPGTALTALARMNGLNVTVDGRFVPSAIADREVTHETSGPSLRALVHEQVPAASEGSEGRC